MKFYIWYEDSSMDEVYAKTPLEAYILGMGLKITKGEPYEIATVQDSDGWYSEFEIILKNHKK